MVHSQLPIVRRLLGAAAMAALLATDYRDRWRHDRATVVERSREVFGQFAMLTVEREPMPAVGMAALKRSLAYVVAQAAM